MLVERHQMQKTDFFSTPGSTWWGTNSWVYWLSFPCVRWMLLCCCDLKQLLWESLPLRFGDKMEMISSNTLQDISFLLYLAGKEVSLAWGNASGSFMSVENIPLLWESSTGNQQRHDIPFSMLKCSEGIESGQNPVPPCLADVPLSCIEIFQSVHVMVGLKNCKIKSVLSVGGKAVMNVWKLSGNIHALH